MGLCCRPTPSHPPHPHARVPNRPTPSPLCPLPSKVLISMSLSLQERGVIGAFTGWASAELAALALPWPMLFAALHVQVRVWFAEGT